MMVKKKQLYPEPGTWVIEDRPGLPKIEPPEDLEPGNISPRNLRDEQIAYHGLGYCLYSYIPPERIADVQLRLLWRRAQRAMREVVEYLDTIDNKPRKNTVLKQNTKTNNVVGERLL